MFIVIERVASIRKESEQSRPKRLGTCNARCLVDREGGARGLDQTVVGGALAADGGVLAGVLDSDGTTEDTDRDLLAVKTDSTVKNLVEGKAETGKGVRSILALLLLVENRRQVI